MNILCQNGFVSVDPISDTNLLNVDNKKLKLLI